MENVKEDLLKAIAQSCHKVGDIKCAVLSLHFDYDCGYQMKQYLNRTEGDDWATKWKYLVLKDGYTQDELQAFIDATDVEYDTDYGGQELYGYVMFSDESWLERGEYDGSEWWEFKKFFIPEQCKSNNKTN